ncbi:MAG TPA: hypothetical protein VF720_07290 [Candidatus Eisenbacteria bacterium]
MKKSARRRAPRVGEMKPEYDFSNGVRGKHAAQFKDVVFVGLDPDVAAVFNDSATVNRVLRGLIELISPAKPPSAPRRKRKS